MKKITKLLALFLVTAMSVSLFTGCHKEQPDTAKVSIGYWMGGNPDTMEPGMTLDSVAEGILRNTHAPLVRISNEGKMTYRAAKSYDVSDDGLIYTFHLREDAKWSDGKPVLAADFEYGWKRLADPAHICENAYSFTSLKNGMDVIEGNSPSSELGVTAVDNYTLRVELEVPCNYFLSKLGAGTFLPQRKDICEGDDAWFRDVAKLGVSNGPFMVTEWQLNSEMTLEKNPYYYNSDNVKIDEIVIPLIAEKNTAFTAYESNQLDGMVGTPELQRKIIETPNEVIQIPGIAVECVLFNTLAHPFDDIRVRKAFTLAINRTELLKVRASLTSKPLASIIPPGIYFNGEEMHHQGENLFGIDLSKSQLDEAKALLAEAGYPNGEGFPETSILIDGSAAGQELCQILASMWSELGVKVNIHPYEDKVFIDMQIAGDYEISDTCYGDAAEPYNFLETWLPGYGYNSMGFNPPEFEEAFNKASVDPDLTVQKEQLLKAEEIFMDGYAVCPLWYSFFSFYQKTYLKGVEYIIDFPLFENAYVEKDK